MFYEYTLPNGIKVISEPMENRRTVAMGAFIKVGSQNETKENNGISHLVEHMLFKGTKKHSSKDIADITAKMGDDVNAFTSEECTALYGMTISENARELAELIGDMLANPCFDAKELAKEKRVVMDEIDLYSDSAEDFVHEMIHKRVWKEDALGYFVSGTKSVVKKIGSEQLFAFHQQHYCAENILISVAGGYKEEELIDWLWQAFSEVKGCAADRAQKTANRIKKERGKELALDPYYKQYMKKNIPNIKSPAYFCSFAVADRDIEQLHINLAFPGICIRDDRRFVYAVLNSAFGGSNNSRLFQKIREERGMAYSVYSYSSSYERAGLFHIDITVQPQLAVPVFREVEGVIREFVQNGLSDKELAMCKQQIKTELIMSLESPKARMDSNARFALVEMPLYTLEEKLEKIDQVTCGKIIKLAAEIMDLTKCSLCVVGDKKNADLSGLKRAWNAAHLKDKNNN